mmetsp:Transcript_46946/g.52527  ORF Transcript_46946/g.52527 Transcript_46946/m.52527 type:complete len:336 (+) Transcript_46946:132-1139(+)
MVCLYLYSIYISFSCSLYAADAATAFPICNISIAFDNNPSHPFMDCDSFKSTRYIIVENKCLKHFLLRSFAFKVLFINPKLFNNANGNNKSTFAFNCISNANSYNFLDCKNNLLTCCIVLVLVVVVIALLDDDDDDDASDNACRCNVNAKLYMIIMRNFEKNSDEYNGNSLKSLSSTSSSSSLSSISSLFEYVTSVTILVVAALDGKLSGRMKTGSRNTKYLGLRENGEAVPLLQLSLEAIDLCVYDADTDAGTDADASADDDKSFIVSFVLAKAVVSLLSSSVSCIVIALSFVKLITNGIVLLEEVVVSVSLLPSVSVSNRSLSSSMAANGLTK